MKRNTEQHTTHINNKAIKYTVSNERDDGQDHGYYAQHDAQQDGRYYGVVGPWPTADEAAQDYEQTIRKRGGRS